MADQQLHVLMTGGGAPGAAGIIKCLQQHPGISLVIADKDPAAIGRHIIPSFVQIPSGDDPLFAETLLRVCREKKAGLVLPLVTRELLPLSESKEEFIRQGIAVLVSSKESIELSNDKGACYKYLSEKGIEVPAFHIVTSLPEFKQAATDLGYPEHPFCFKPTRSNGSRGFRVVADSLDESDQLFFEKPWSTHITYPHILEILTAKPFPELLLSEYLPGEEYSVDCLAKEGEAVLIVPRTRERSVNGISVRGCFVHDREIISYCSHIISALGLHGNVGIQVKRSSSGKPLLLEINPRVQGTIVSALGAGVNLPLLAVKQELGWPVWPHETEVAWGTRFARHWTEIFYR